MLLGDFRRCVLEKCYSSSPARWSLCQQHETNDWSFLQRLSKAWPTENRKTRVIQKLKSQHFKQLRPKNPSPLLWVSLFCIFAAMIEKFSYSKQFWDFIILSINSFYSIPAIENYGFGSALCSSTLSFCIIYIFYSLWIKTNLLFTVAFGFHNILQRAWLNKVGENKRIAVKWKMHWKKQRSGNISLARAGIFLRDFFITLIYLSPGNWFTFKGHI